MMRLTLWLKRWIQLLKAQMVSLLQIFQIVLIFTKDRLHKHSVVKIFIDLYGSLSAEEKEILTDACKIFVIKGKDVALAKGEYSNLKITTVTDLKIAKSMIEKDQRHD